jgi:hypothetical protein
VSEPAAIPCWRVVALVGRVGSNEILVEDVAGAPQLPIAAEALPVEPFDGDAFSAIAAALGVATVPIRQTWLPNEDWTAGTVVAEVEPLTTAPDGYRWHDPTAATAELEPEAARDVVRRRLERANGTPAPHAPVWATTGWFERASTWMVERMTAVGQPPTEPPVLVYQGPIAAVLRAATDGEAMFLKCVAPAFPHEASITAAVARRSPGWAPDVVAIDPDEDWLLMRDHGGRLLENEPEAAWPAAMLLAARLQRAWIDRTGDLLAAGGQYRPLSALAAAIPAMLERDEFGARMPADLRDAWIAAVPRLVDACTELDGLAMPDALIHGDLHPGNVVLGPDGPMVIDWSDGAVGHSFIDLPTFLLRVDGRTRREGLIDAYLEGWAGIAPRSTLETAAELAMPVGAAYQVATYQALLPAMDEPDRALFDNVDVSWARRTLDCLEHGLDAVALEA